MSRFQSQLNAKELREFFDPQGTFAKKHVAGAELLRCLKEADFHICEVKDAGHHIWIRLGCGAILLTYLSGKVLVQGRLLGQEGRESKRLLDRLLPADTIWQLLQKELPTRSWQR